MKTGVLTYLRYLRQCHPYPNNIVPTQMGGRERESEREREDGRRETGPYYIVFSGTVSTQGTTT